MIEVRNGRSVPTVIQAGDTMIYYWRDHLVKFCRDGCALEYGSHDDKHPLELETMQQFVQLCALVAGTRELGFGEMDISLSSDLWRCTFTASMLSPEVLALQVGDIIRFSPGGVIEVYRSPKIYTLRVTEGMPGSAENCQFLAKILAEANLLDLGDCKISLEEKSFSFEFLPRL